MAYRLSFSAALPYQNADGSWTAIYDAYVGDYPEDVPALLQEMKRLQNEHNRCVAAYPEKKFPTFIWFAPIYKVHNQFVDKKI